MIAFQWGKTSLALKPGGGGARNTHLGQSPVGNIAYCRTLSVPVAGSLHLAAVVLRSKILAFIAMGLALCQGEFDLCLSALVEIDRGGNHRESAKLHFRRKSSDFPTM